MEGVQKIYREVEISMEMDLHSPFLKHEDDYKFYIVRKWVLHLFRRQMSGLSNCSAETLFKNDYFGSVISLTKRNQENDGFSLLDE